ncbi:MAG: DUF308 domain-containing protein, partial [Caldilineaceae bacterium]|nr:DUF308 domain-containing protein [Caldilineaceae bacterium]
MTTAVARNDNPITPWWVVLLQGIASIIIGFFLLTSPGVTTLFLIQVLGWYWLISGILSLVMIFVDSTGWGWKLLMGILGIIAGLYIVNHPLVSTLMVPTTLIIVMAVQGLIIGVIGLIQAFQGGGLGAGVLGALSIIFGIILLGSPVIAAVALPWVFGIFAIAGGIVSIIAA